MTTDIKRLWSPEVSRASAVSLQYRPKHTQYKSWPQKHARGALLHVTPEKNTSGSLKYSPACCQTRWWSRMTDGKTLLTSYFLLFVDLFRRIFVWSWNGQEYKGVHNLMQLNNCTNCVCVCVYLSSSDKTGRVFGGGQQFSLNIQRHCSTDR